MVSEVVMTDEEEEQLKDKQKHDRGETQRLLPSSGGVGDKAGAYHELQMQNQNPISTPANSYVPSESSRIRSCNDSLDEDDDVVM